MTDLPPPLLVSSDFAKELASLINRYSLESGSDTPDFILAEYVAGCIATYNATIVRREQWYGRRTAEAVDQGTEIATGHNAGSLVIDPEALYADMIKEAEAKDIIQRNDAGKWRYQCKSDDEYSNYNYDSGYQALRVRGDIPDADPAQPTLDMDEVLREKKAAGLQTLGRRLCGICVGTGSVRGKRCTNCLGNGNVKIEAEKTDTRQAVDSKPRGYMCPKCGGRGWQHGPPPNHTMLHCTNCDGSGFLKRDKPKDERMTGEMLLFHLQDRHAAVPGMPITARHLVNALELMGLLKPQS